MLHWRALPVSIQLLAEVHVEFLLAQPVDPAGLDGKGQFVIVRLVLA